MSSIDDEGGDAPCWAHLFADEDEPTTDEPDDSDEAQAEDGAAGEESSA